MCRLVVAKRNAAAAGRRVRRGTVLCADDPVVKRAPGLFEPYLLQHHCKSAPVEQATAAPGERRTVQLPEAEKPSRRRTPSKPAESEA